MVPPSVTVVSDVNAFPKSSVPDVASVPGVPDDGTTAGVTATLATMSSFTAGGVESSWYRYESVTATLYTVGSIDVFARSLAASFTR